MTRGKLTRKEKKKDVTDTHKTVYPTFPRPPLCHCLLPVSSSEVLCFLLLLRGKHAGMENIPGIHFQIIFYHVN